MEHSGKILPTLPFYPSNRLFQKPLGSCFVEAIGAQELGAPEAIGAQELGAPSSCAPIASIIDSY